MMKISKPVLMNDYIVSPVQFTSLNLVSFKNIKPVYDGNEKILLEYEHPAKIESSSRDWIGIFPRGWSSLQQYVTFEWISQSVPSPSVDQMKESGETIKRTIAFCPKYHMNCVNQSAFYQFVYVGKQIEVLGVSSYFRFDLTCVNDSSLEIECLVPVTGKIRSTSVSDFGTISMTNEQSSTSIDSRKLIHTASIHSLQNLDVDGKLSWSRMNFTDDKKNMCLMKRTGASPSGTGDNLDPYSSHSEPVFPMSLPLAQCKKCYQFKRGGDILRSQQVLQSKVGPSSEEASGLIYRWKTLGKPYLIHDKLKIVMERNKVLEERSQELKKELERLQAESKRMKMSYYNINKEKVAYEKFVKDFIKSLEKDSIVRVMYGNTEILVKKVNYVGMEEHPRDKKTSKRERELKAVIGLQEITIRNLINSLQEKAKSVEELNQTVKLAQVFSAARADPRELGIDPEESSDEVSNSDSASEYEFTLTKPPPPEEVVGDADEVLDSIRRKSEIELKNIGINRSLGSNPGPSLDVTNLSIMTYAPDDDAMPKKPRLVDNIDDCWPFPRAQNKSIRKKFPEDDAKRTEPNGNEYEECQSPPTDDPNVESVEMIMSDDSDSDMRKEPTTEDIGSGQEADFDMDTSACEHFYDAYDAFSVRSYSPEAEGYPSDDASVPMDVERSDDVGDREEDKNRERNEFLLTAIVPQKSDSESDDEGKALASPPPPEKFNKFTCELSIDFGQKRCPASPSSDGAIPAREVPGSERGVVAVRQSDPALPSDESRIYSLERERSLITFKKSNKRLEIKITQVDQKERQTRSGFHQKMVVQFSPDRMADGPRTEEDSDSSKRADTSSNSSDGDGGREESPGQSDPDGPEPLEEGESVDSNESGVGAGNGSDAPDEGEGSVDDGGEEPPAEGTDFESSSPRTEWNDADDVLGMESPDRGRYPENARYADHADESGAESQTAKEKAIMQLEEKKTEIAQEFLKSKCNIQMLTEDSMNNLKIYQDSLRYEKNLQFLNNKFDGKSKESDDETLKEKPSAILIQSGQAKVALIRYQ